MLHMYVTHSCISGSAVAEEGRRPCLQHLYGDSGWERRTGRLGPSDLSLPFPSAAGESDSHRHTELWVSSDHHILCVPQEPHVGAEGLQGAGLSPGQLRLLQRFRPELSWDQSGTATSLPHRADRDTIGFFIAKFLKTWPACLDPHKPPNGNWLHASVGQCWQMTLVFLPRHSFSLKTAGNVGISFVNTD